MHFIQITENISYCTFINNTSELYLQPCCELKMLCIFSIIARCPSLHQYNLLKSHISYIILWQVIDWTISQFFLLTKKISTKTDLDKYSRRKNLNRSNSGFELLKLTFI